MSSFVTAINANTPPATTPSATSGSSGQTLTQQDFLKIMVAQFTQQDPLSSGSDGGGNNGTSDYVNQLMAMTNLTTMQTMSSQLTVSTGQQALELATNLQGSTVEVGDGQGNVISGVVQRASVNTTNDDVMLTINGVQYSSANLVSIDETAAQTLAAAGTATAAPTNP